MDKEQRKLYDEFLESLLITDLQKEFISVVVKGLEAKIDIYKHGYETLKNILNEGFRRDI